MNITIYKDYFNKDPIRHFGLHRDAEIFAKENNIKIYHGDAYVFSIVYEFEDDEALLAFKLRFGEIVES